jgi:hypothetical protein
VKWHWCAAFQVRRSGDEFDCQDCFDFLMASLEAQGKPAEISMKITCHCPSCLRDLEGS